MREGDRRFPEESTARSHGEVGEGVGGRGQPEASGSGRSDKAMGRGQGRRQTGL